VKLWQLIVGLILVAIIAIAVTQLGGSSSDPSTAASKGQSQSETLTVAESRSLDQLLSDVRKWCQPYRGDLIEQTEEQTAKEGASSLLPEDARSAVSVFREKPTATYSSSGGGKRSLEDVLIDAATQLDPATCLGAEETSPEQVRAYDMLEREVR
jgi:hypothetical protein